MNKYILILALLGCHTQSPQEKREQIEQDSIEAMAYYASYRANAWINVGSVWADSFQRTNNSIYLKMLRMCLDSAMKWDSIEKQNLEKLK